MSVSWKAKHSIQKKERYCRIAHYSDLKKIKNIVDIVDTMRNVVKDVEVWNLCEKFKKSYKIKLQVAKKKKRSNI